MRFAVLALFACTIAAPVLAQAAAAQKPAPAPATAPAAPAPNAASMPPQPENYTYNPDGRRDPFLNLINAGDSRGVVSRRGEGPSGMSVNEIVVRGVVQNRGSYIAMVQGPDNRTYIVHAGDKLLDGTIKTINAQGLIVMQEVNDPLSLIKQREIVKLLRSLESVKQ